MRILAAAAALPLLLAALPARAGFTLQTDATLVDVVNPGLDTVFDPGDRLVTAAVPGQGTVSGTFSGALRDTPQDPDFAPISQFAYGLDLTAAGPGPAPGSISFSGGYAIQRVGQPGGPADVSRGIARLILQGSLSAGGSLTGTLTQSSGPAGPGLPDLSYCGPLQYTGQFSPLILQPGSQVGLLVGSISCTAPAVPEPSSLALLLGATPLLFRRRR